MTTNNVRARTYLKLLFGTGAVLILFRVFSGHVVPRPTDITAGLDRLRPAPAPSIIPEPVTTVDTLPCAKLAGANETLVIIKTGATEIKDKLPVHFDTTLRCYPHSIIFSDYEEEYSGYQVVDALANVDKTLQDSHPDFELWRRLKEGGRAVLADDELSGPGVKLSGGLGKPENPGWKLDKWKFLPMLNETLVRYPEMKWYVFVETDTYIFWTTTLAWLATLDHTKPHYMGAQMQIGEVVFAHGGSAFVISQASMRAAVELYRANQKEWEDFTNGHWAGDCVLGKALADSGTSLTWAWPIFQGVKPGGIDYSRLDYSKRIWCYPTISYHHMSPDEVADTWLFEEDMMAKGNNLVRHKDVYNEYILPWIKASTGRKADWDNLSGDGEDAVSVDDCRSRCEAKSTCVQYSYSEGNCATTEVPKMGQLRTGVESGWFPNRAQDFASNMGACGDELWISK